MLENSVPEEGASLTRVADRNMKKTFFRKRSGCILCLPTEGEVSYKNPELIRKFTSEVGRILPRRITGICATHQRRLQESVKIARMIALLPF